MTRRKTKWRFWRVARVCFRWSRITVWLLFLGCLLSLAYLHFFGLPDFAQNKIRSALKSRGILVDFSNIRLAYKGLIATDLKVSRPGPASPVFTSAETEIHLHVRQLLKKQVALDFLKIQSGAFQFGSSSTNSWGLAVHHIETEIHLPHTNEIHLNEFKAEFRGAKINFSGIITNFQEIPSWPVFASTGAPKKEFDLDRLKDLLDRIEIGSAPQLQANLKGDAHFPTELQGEISLKIPAIKTPWGDFAGLEAASSLHRPKDVKIQKFGDLSLRFKEARTPWGKASDLQLSVKYNPDRSLTNSVAADILLQASSMEVKVTNQTSVTLHGFDLSGSVLQTATNPIPSQAQLKLKALSASQGGQEIKNLDSSFQFSRLRADPLSSRADLGFWTFLTPFTARWDIAFNSLTRTNLQLSRTALAGSWNPPFLTLNHLDSSLYDGSLKASGRLDITSRVVEAKVESTLDPKKIQHLIPPSGRNWLAKYNWETAPRLQAQLALQAPPWTGDASESPLDDLRRSLLLTGSFQLAKSSYRLVEVLQASGSFSYSNFVWRLPDIRVQRPEGGLRLGLVANDESKNFFFDVDSSLDPLIARVILPSSNEKAWQFAKFSTPPRLKARIWGNFEDPSLLAAEGEIDVTNITVRAIDYDRITASVSYTNKIITVREPRIYKGENIAQAKEVSVDLNKQIVGVVDGTTTIDPLIVTASISDHAYDAIAPYHFAAVPKVLANGWISMTKIESVDLTFDVDGGALKWLVFQADTIKGRVRWLNEGLIVTNVTATGYKTGNFAGWALFDFRPKRGTDYQFSLAFNDMDIPAIVQSIKPASNRKLDGLLDGLLVVTYANTSDANSFQGYGRLSLRDGFIWEIPIFGIFSPAINLVLPGFGKSKAKAAAGHFVITNSVASTQDLEIHASAVRLLYKGSVDLNQKLEASVEAELLRDTPLLGKIISLVFMPFSKLFEYNVTGTLSNPELHAKYLPLPKKIGPPAKEKSEDSKPDPSPEPAPETPPAPNADLAPTPVPAPKE